MIDLIASAIDRRKDPGFTFLLMGDLQTMSAQKTYLKEKGFEVGQVDCYPALKPGDVERALRLFWDERVIDWCVQHRNKLIELGICTEEEFVREYRRRYGR